MSYWYIWLSLVSVAILAVACAGSPSPLAETIAGLGDQRYQVEYQLATYIEGTAKPVVASGNAEFEGSGRWLISQHSVLMEYVGTMVRVKDGDTWRVEEIVELPIHPLVYLKAARDVSQIGGDEGNHIFSFKIDRARYREALGQVLGEVPSPLDEVIARFSGTGELTLDVQGRPTRMRVFLKDSSAVQPRTRQELEIRFLDAAGDHPILADRPGISVGGWER